MNPLRRTWPLPSIPNCQIPLSSPSANNLHQQTEYTESAKTRGGVRTKARQLISYTQARVRADVRPRLESPIAQGQCLQRSYDGRAKTANSRGLLRERGRWP